MSRVGHTLPREVSSVLPAAAQHLFLVLTCHSPGGASVRIPLGGVDQLVIGRSELEPGSAPQVRREGTEVLVAVADDRMSGKHAAIRRMLGDALIEDLQSLNGTVVNGRRIEREPLRDGDLIELGHTFFLFRAAVTSGLEAAPIEDAAAPAFATLLPALAADFRRAEAIAPSRVPVLIRGETGTGKDMVASAIHALSGRSGRFVAVNCGGLSPSLLQSELQGHCKGAFTGAGEDREGFIRGAHGGTLFLDGVEDLPLAGQQLLLRVLEQGEVVPVGTTRGIPVDVRVVAATQVDLEALAAQQRFRADLCARLKGLTLVLPPLRERREDLGLIVRALLGRHLGPGAKPAAFSREAARALFLYRWPMNVRELEKALHAAVVLARGEPIGFAHLPAAVRAAVSPSPAPSPSAATPPPAASTGLLGKIQHFFDEASRRRVPRVLIAYCVAVFGALQGADVIVTRLNLPPQWMTVIVGASLAGLPLAGVLAWVFDWTSRGIVKTAPLSPAQKAALAPGRSRRRRRLALAACILALLTVAGTLWWRNRLVLEDRRPLTGARNKQ